LFQPDDDFLDNHLEELRSRIHVAVQKNIFSLNLRNSYYEKHIRNVIKDINANAIAAS